MEATEGTITLEEDGMSVEQTLFTYSEQERQENTLNKINADLIWKPEFFTVDYAMLHSGFSMLETALHGFIKFFLKNNERFYCSSERLSKMFCVSEGTIDKAIKTLKEKWLIEVTWKPKAKWWRIRFIQLREQEIPNHKKCASNISEPQNLGFAEAQNLGCINNKYIKNKENKKRKFLEYVFLTDEEYNKLVTDYWTKVINSKIEDLNYRIGENPQEKKRQKKSHYNTLLKRLKNAWVEKKRPAPNNESWVYENLREQDLYLQSLIEWQK